MAQWEARRDFYMICLSLNTFNVCIISNASPIAAGFNTALVCLLVQVVFGEVGAVRLGSVSDAMLVPCVKVTCRSQVKQDAKCRFVQVVEGYDIVKTIEVGKTSLPACTQ